MRKNTSRFVKLAFAPPKDFIIVNSTNSRKSTVERKVKTKKTKALEPEAFIPLFLLVLFLLFVRIRIYRVYARFYEGPEIKCVIFISTRAISPHALRYKALRCALYYIHTTTRTRLYELRQCTGIDQIRLFQTSQYDSSDP